MGYRLLKSKKFRNFLLWTGLSLYLIFMLGYITQKVKSVPCKAMEVVILDTNSNHFIHQNDIKLLIKDEYSQVVGEPLDNVNIADLEVLIEEYPSVKSAEIYKTIAGELIVEVKQRTPVVRVISDDGYSFYVDNEGKMMPLSEKYASRVIVANGFIDSTCFVTDTLGNIDYSEPVTELKSVINDIYTVSNYIFNHPFWKAQFEQIYVDSNGEFELIPKIGAHIIEFGTIDSYQWKFRKLEAVYKEGFKRLGWNNYLYINLKYKDQVVCTKRKT